MNTRFKGSRTFFSSAPARYDCTYQSGGTVLTINGHTTGRIVTYGEDEMGRFCWVTLRGKRDEGICIINGYRSCHERHHKPGPHTAYMEQYAIAGERYDEPKPASPVLD